MCSRWIPLGGGVKVDNTAEVVEEVWKFETDHSAVVAVVVLGILVISAPWRCRVLGELGPIDGQSLIMSPEISSYLVFL